MSDPGLPNTRCEGSIFDGTLYFFHDQVLNVKWEALVVYLVITELLQQVPRTGISRRPSGRSTFSIHV
jgi:hypothetical protein